MKTFSIQDMDRISAGQAPGIGAAVTPPCFNQYARSFSPVQGAQNSAGDQIADIPRTRD